MGYKKPTYNKVMGPDLQGMEFIAADLSASAIVVIGVIGIVVIVAAVGPECSCIEDSAIDQIDVPGTLK